MQKTLHESFFSHMARYVGVGLISGSVVHAGTLGGETLKYVVLIALGVILFTAGILVEHKGERIKNLLGFVLISVVVSIGTGMVSGATQHYLDGPKVGAILLSVGLLLAYIAFAWRDYKNLFTFKRIAGAVLISFILWLGLSTVTPILYRSIDSGHIDIDQHGH